MRDAVDVEREVDVTAGVTFQLRARDVQRKHLLAARLDVGHLLEVELDLRIRKKTFFKKQTESYLNKFKDNMIP